MRDFRLYMLVGGMPQSVNEYITTNNFRKVDMVKRDILNVGGKIAGVVINKMPIAQKEYYSSYYYGQSSSGSGSSGSAKKHRSSVDFESRIRPAGQSNRLYNIEKDGKE